MTTASEAQFAGNRLIDAMTVADLNALRTLTPEQLERQVAARGELVHYLTVVWEQAKQRGEDPANNPLYLGIGSARDLMNTLHSYATDPSGYADELRIDTADGRAALALDQDTSDSEGD